MAQPKSSGTERGGISAVLPGKIGRPRLRAVVARERLFAALERLRTRPIVWVTGPAGAGKTTLLASYLEVKGQGELWYPIDARDQDLASFFYFLGQAANAGRRRRAPLPVLTPEYLLGLPTFTRRFFRALFERLPTGHVLVLDNYQEVPAEGPFQEMMRVALEEVPPGYTVLVASRHRPPPAFARLQANGLLTVLGWPELRLTEAEAQAIARQRASTAVPVTAVNACLARTGGWVAGLVLWLEAAQTTPALPATTEAPEALFDYFATELLAKLEPTTRDLLLTTALLPQIRPALAATLTANPQAERVLSTLVHRNMFTTRHLGRETRYQYHPLFRTYLLAEGPKRLGETRYHALKRRAAELLEAAGDVEPGIEYRLALRDWAPLAARLAEVAPTLLAQGRNQTLLGWLHSVPEAVQTKHPWLAYWRGTALLPLDPRAARPILHHAYHGFKQTADVNGLYLAWSSIAYSYCVERYFAPLGPWLDEFYSLRLQHPGLIQRKVEIETTTRIYCAMVTCRPEETALPQWEQALIGLLNEDLPLDTRLLAASHLVWRNSLHGGSRAVASEALTNLQSWVGSSDVSPLSEILALSLKAAYDFWYTSRPEICLGATETGLAKAYSHGVHVWNALLLTFQGWVQLTEAQPQAGNAATDELERSSIPECHHDEAVCAYLRAWHAWLCDDLEGAQEHARIACSEWIDSGMRVAYMFPPVALAQIAASQGAYVEALRHLSTARRVARETHYHNVEFMCLLADARVALERDQPARCRAFLRRALAIGRRQGYVRIPFFKREDFARLYQVALEAGIETDYAERVLRERGLLGPAMAAGSSGNGALRVYTLGRFELAQDGQPMRFGRKAPKRALELLQALLAFGANPVPRPRLAVAVWGDETPQSSGQAALRTTLHRLRKLLGEALIIVDEGRIGLDEKHCWVDAWAFDALLDEAQAAKRNPHADRWPGLAEQALALYHGPFLGAEVQTPWSFPTRERLRQRFVATLDALARHWQAHGNADKAIDLYERGLAVDELAEPFYQGLMRNHHALGQRAEAIRVYHRCRRLLQTHLNRSPSPATQALYGAIHTA